MAKDNYSTVISVLHPICCGLDVHKKTISACLISTDINGKEEIEIREFGTFKDELIELKDWLSSKDCPIVAMESTGVYWYPVQNVLEGYVEVIIANAHHIKNVPGRKTDIKDCKWIAGLLRHGLLKGSYIPEKRVREWRDLTRLRRKYVETVADYQRRTQKLFETGNINREDVIYFSINHL